MEGLIVFWSHAVAAGAFAALLVWRIGAGDRSRSQQLLLAAFAITACWAWISGLYTGSPLAAYAETARNFIWVSLLYSLSASGDERQQGARLVYAAVAAVFGFQCAADALFFLTETAAAWETAILLRITAAAGGLVLVHNLYGQAAPTSRTSIRLTMLGLAIMWVYDLNLHTVTYINAALSGELIEWRGLAIALTTPLFALGARRDDGWRVSLSRAATFQSLSLLAICAYFAVMAVLATATRNLGLNLPGLLLIALLAVMTVGAMVVLPSARARSWAKVKVAKHLFEHRYDYRTEWLRFTETLGSADQEAPRIGERIARAIADILEAPASLLVTADESGNLAGTSSWHWEGATPPLSGPEPSYSFWAQVGSSGRIIEFDALRYGWADARERGLGTPAWVLDDPTIWVGVPLIHHQRLEGLVLLSAPDYRRPLDWEDFDLLRTAGRQAASSLAEAHGQEALSTAQRFEEFNRRFAFILHDIKNLVSQLSLLTRNAERHADNAEFRADMIATLKSSVSKMNDLLTRLAPQAGQRPLRSEPQPIGPILTSAVAAKRRSHEIRMLGDPGLWAEVDANSLEQAVGHLLQNAVEASPPTEPVTVRISARGAEIEITIADKGCGMDGDFVRTRLFKPFASTKASGFGIGTFEARSLILAMGGRVAVDSRPGQGTTFAILLPAAQAASEPERMIA